MKTAICVPWRPSDPTREEAWVRVQQHLLTGRLPVFTGNSDPSRPFNRSQARNVAASYATDYDVLMFLDADHIVPWPQIEYAIDHAYSTGDAIHPYDRVEVLDLPSGQHWRTKFDLSYTSGTIVLSRSLYEQTGGWDERFESWGWEDIAFETMLIHLTGATYRVEGMAFNFTHQRPDTEVELGEPPELMQRYRAIQTFAEAEAMAAEVRAYRGA